MRKLVLRNGKIYVERGRFAQALYAEDGVIQAVGTEEEVLTAAGKRDGSGNGLDGAEIIDLEGRTVIPGINDSHMHLLNVGMDFATAPITGVSSVDDRSPSHCHSIREPTFPFSSYLASRTNVFAHKQ